MESRKHREIAEKIATQKSASYHSDRGVDIRTTEQAIEVEVDSGKFPEAKKQLAGTTKTPYLAVPNNLLSKALDFVDGTRLGVMNENGNIVKRGRKKKAK